VKNSQGAILSAAVTPGREGSRLTRSHRFSVAGVLALAVSVLPSVSTHGQPADEGAAAMNARLAGAALNHVGPSYLYPKQATTPGLVNPNVTQANIQQTICTSGFTDTVRPSSTVTTNLKKKQLKDIHASDQNASHYEEDHFISLELGGHPRDPRNLWPERWGTPGHPLTRLGPFPSHLVGAKTKDAVENALKKAVCDGTLTLREAQYIIATDWFKYYRDKVLK
jgi:hypothetical protein